MTESVSCNVRSLWDRLRQPVIFLPAQVLQRDPGLQCTVPLGPIETRYGSRTSLLLVTQLQCTVPLGPIETLHFGSRTSRIVLMLQCTVPLGPIETILAESLE